jgi:predicted Zn-dependent protease
MLRGQSYGVFIEHSARAVTSVGNNRMRDWQVGDELAIQFWSRFGSGLPVGIASNQTDPASLQRLIDRAVALLPPPPPPNEVEPEDPDAPEHFTFNPRPFLPVSLWSDRTAHAIETPTNDAVDAVVSQVQDATRTPLTPTVTSVLSARSTLYLYPQGLTAWAHETDCELTLTTRNPDGTESGWAGHAHRDWGMVTPATVAHRALQLATWGNTAVAVEPGRRTVILSPVAVGQLVRFMATGFRNGMAGPLFGPKSFTPAETFIGKRVFDERLRMRSDPADPDGGFPPFFELNGNDPAGLPYPAMTWVDGGVLKHLAAGLMGSYGQWCEVPYSMRVEAMPGTELATIEQMIASCGSGIYVNRFGSLRVLDERTGMMTGVTRDGCFLVRDGKIDKRAKNFRFVESPFHAFNRLRMIGAAERVPLGNDSPTDGERYSSFGWPRAGRWSRWPRVPIIAPSMMIDDFNFSSLADAV